MLSRPILLSASTASRRAPSENAAKAARRAIEPQVVRRAPGGGGSRLGSRWAATWGLQVGRRAGPRPRRRARRASRPGAGRWRPVGVEHFLGHAGPGEALDVGSRRAGHLGPPRRLLVEVAQSLGQCLGVGGRNEHPVDAIAHDIAVAGDVGGDDRRAGGKGLGQHHAEALAPQRRGAQHVGAPQLGGLALVVDLAQRAHAAVVDEQRRQLLMGGPDDRQLAGDVLAQGLEGAQQQRQALALDRLADEGDLQRLCLGGQRPGGATACCRTAGSTCTPFGMIR